jgi:hypothetical protein
MAAGFSVGWRRSSGGRIHKTGAWLHGPCPGLAFITHSYSTTDQQEEKVTGNKESNGPKAGPASDPANLANVATRPFSKVVPIKGARKKISRDIPEWMHGPAARWDGWDLGPGWRLVLVDGDTPRDVA